MTGVDAYAVWRALPFPSGSGSDNDDLDEIHADLAYWDAMVADSVIPVVESGATFRPGVLDYPGGFASLEAQIAGLEASASGSDAAKLNEYRRYLDALVAVFTQVGCA